MLSETGSGKSYYEESNDRSIGYYKTDTNTWEAFDNSSGACNVEVFSDENIALAWLLRCDKGWFKSGTTLVGFEFVDLEYYVTDFHSIPELTAFLTKTE